MHTMAAAIRTGLTLLSLIFMLSACSASNSPAPSAPSTPTASVSNTPAKAASNIDVCSLVTAQEMSQIVGETVTSEPKTLQTGIPACSYKAASGNPIPGVVIGIHTPNGKVTYKSAQSLYKGSPRNQEVSGIGEQAFDSGDGAFYALKGDSCLDIVLTQKPDLRLNQFKQIATLAIGRMP